MTTITNVLAEDLIATLPDSIRNMVLAWASNTTLTISSGWCRDSTSAFNIVFSSTVTINAAVRGINGIDTGTFAASKVYAVHAVMDSTGRLLPGAIISLSATAPTMPSGYDKFRRIGWAITDGSTHFLLIWQSGLGNQRIYSYDEPLATPLTAGAETSFTAVALTNLVPVVNNLSVGLQLAFTPNAASDTANIIAGASSATTGIVTIGQAAGVVVNDEIHALSQLVTAVPTIQYKVSTGSAALAIKLVSFIDNV